MIKVTDNTDLVTDEEFENFDLKLEFKTDTCANSGVMFYVHEASEISKHLGNRT